MIAESEGTLTSVQTSRTRIALSAFALLIAAAVAVTGLLVPGMAEAAKKGKQKSSVVKVMTRNVYLGADLDPAIKAASQTDFLKANGAILRQVDENSFAVRAKGLAREIRSTKPDLVGLQEVARWATGPPDLAVLNDPSKSTAKTVKYDFLNMLMAELNLGAKRYRVVKVTKEFEFEAPADYNLDTPSLLDINGRLTMRDVIIAKVGKSVKTRGKPKGGNYKTIYSDVVGGFNVDVARGWNSVEAKVGKSPWFTFANTHLEAFGDEKNEVVDCMKTPAPAYASNQVSIRCRQAKEFFDKVVKPSKLPVIAAGDFNSDDRTAVDADCPGPDSSNGGVCGDTFAYNALKTLGMRNVSTYSPPSCCIASPNLIAVGGGGEKSQFVKHIDHILTDQPARKVKLIGSAVTGRSPQNGFWNSDHAGVFSKLRLTR